MIEASFWEAWTAMEDSEFWCWITFRPPKHRVQDCSATLLFDIPLIPQIALEIRMAWGARLKHLNTNMVQTRTSVLKRVYFVQLENLEQQ
jgi:hypothetical protein